MRHPTGSWDCDDGNPLTGYDGDALLCDANASGLHGAGSRERDVDDDDVRRSFSGSDDDDDDGVPCVLLVMLG